MHTFMYICMHACMYVCMYECTCLLAKTSRDAPASFSCTRRFCNSSAQSPSRRLQDRNEKEEEEEEAQEGEDEETRTGSDCCST
jgi:hypothetical protein